MIYRYFFIAVMVLTASCDGLSSSMEEINGSAQPPNFLIILADDLFYCDVSFQARIPDSGCISDVETPNIDRIGQLVYSRAYAHTTCAPSRIMLQTGRYTERFPDFETTRALPDEAVTIAEVLATAGYTSGYFGKWHLGTGPGSFPLDQGYDRFFGYDDGLPLFDDTDTAENPGDYVDLATAIVEKAATWMNTAPNPRLTFVALNMPHLPLDPLPEDVALFGTTPRDTMRAVVHRLDLLVGDLLAQAGPDDVIIFMGDNGGIQDSPYGSNGLLRAGKATLFEGGIRVPMVMRVPSAAASGVFPRPVHAIDLLPTLSTMAGVAPPPVDGQHLFDPTPRPLFWYTPTQAAVWSGDWKFYRFGQERFLFHRSDLSEENNVALERPALRDSLEALWKVWSEETDQTPKPAFSVR